MRIGVLISKIIRSFYTYRLHIHMSSTHNLSKPDPGFKKHRGCGRFLLRPQPIAAPIGRPTMETQTSCFLRTRTGFQCRSDDASRHIQDIPVKISTFAPISVAPVSYRLATTPPSMLPASRIVFTPALSTHLEFEPHDSSLLPVGEFTCLPDYAAPTAIGCTACAFGCGASAGACTYLSGYATPTATGCKACAFGSSAFSWAGPLLERAWLSRNTQNPPTGKCLGKRSVCSSTVAPSSSGLPSGDLSIPSMSTYTQKQYP
jgi:hypothetical protein